MLSSIMDLIYILSRAALDLAGIFFNIRMLQNCFKDKTKNTFLQKCRTFIIFQCACQVTILVTNALQSWKLLFDIPLRESCDIFRALTISVMFFQPFNLVILINHSYHPMECENCRGSLKLKAFAALSLAFIGSAMIWYSCLWQEFPSQTAVNGILFAVMIAFVVLLFATDSRNNIPDQLEETTAKTSMKTGALLWKVCKENKRSVLFIALLLICLAVIVWVSPRSSLSIDFGQAKLFDEFELVYSLITTFVFGIVLPLTISDLTDDSYVQVNERTILVI